MLAKDMVTDDFLTEAAKIMAGEPYLNDDTQEQLKALLGEDAYNAIKDRLQDKSPATDSQAVAPDPENDDPDDANTSGDDDDDSADPATEDKAGANGGQTDPDAGNAQLEQNKQAEAERALAVKLLTDMAEGASPEMQAALKAKMDALSTPRTRKDALGTFSEYLDTALDSALLGGIDAIYYAWVCTFSGGSWWSSGDPDQLSREDFNAVCQAFAAACVALYDKLADDEEMEPMAAAAAMQEHFAQARDTTEKGLRARMLEHLTALAETPDKQDKKGKRHSRHDEVQMSMIHGGLVNMGYNGCVPASDPDGDGDDDTNDASDASGSKQADLTDVQDKGSPLTFAWDAHRLDALGVTVSGSDSVTVVDNNDPEETRKRLDAVTAELDQVQAGSSGIVKSLQAARDELLKRVTTQDAEARDKALAETRQADPLETRDKVKISDKGRKAINLSGRLESVPTQLVDDTDTI